MVTWRYEQMFVTLGARDHRRSRPPASISSPSVPRSARVDGFHPAVGTWFRRRFPEGPTPPQRDGWPRIAAGEDVLIAAPTGSGKTLAAFLECINRLYLADEAGEPIDRHRARRVRVAVESARGRHRREPATAAPRDRGDRASSSGSTRRSIGVGVRTGDTPSAERARLVRKPPSFVVTTPESLYLLVTSASGRAGAAHDRHGDRRRDPRRRARQARLAPRAHARAVGSAVRLAAEPGRPVGDATTDRDGGAGCWSATGRCRRSSTAGTSAPSTSGSSCRRARSKRSRAPSRWPTCSTASPRSSKNITRRSCS